MEKMNCHGSKCQRRSKKKGKILSKMWSWFYKSTMCFLAVVEIVPLCPPAGCPKPSRSIRCPMVHCLQGPGWTGSPVSHSGHWPSRRTSALWTWCPDRRPNLADKGHRREGLGHTGVNWTDDHHIRGKKKKTVLVGWKPLKHLRSPKMFYYRLLISFLDNVKYKVTTA